MKINWEIEFCTEQSEILNPLQYYFPWQILKIQANGISHYAKLKIRSDLMPGSRVLKT